MTTESNAISVPGSSSSSSTTRSINEIVDLPYSELTTEELERIIEYKASIKARDKAHEERMAAIDALATRLVEESRRQAQEAMSRQQELYEISLARYKTLWEVSDSE